MSPAQIAVRVLFALTIVGLGHYYLWRRFIRDTEVSLPLRSVLLTALIASAASLPLVFLLPRLLPRAYVAPWAFGAYVWMGIISIITALFFCVDAIRATKSVGRLALRLVRREDKAIDDPEKRRTLSRLVAGAVALVAFGFGAAGVREAMKFFSVKRVKVDLAKLPPQLHGFRIVQLTDVHVGPTLGRGFVENMVAEANALEPDIIAITGDLVDGSVAELGQHTAPLADLRAKHGVYFVTGNHEYYSGAEEWIAELERLGIVVLDNERVEIESGQAGFSLAGIPDHSSKSHGAIPDLARALHGLPAEREVVLLAHQPRAVKMATEHDVGLVLSGHTHGGQYWPFNWFVYLAQPVVKGLARFGRTQIYVSTGTGYWGPPMRLGTESEITLIELQSATRAATRSATRTPSTAALTMPPA
jgi:predicted MPP superfamily phosphohydrolase